MVFCLQALFGQPASFGTADLAPVAGAERRELIADGGEDGHVCAAGEWPLRGVSLLEIVDHDRQALPRFVELVLDRLRVLNAKDQTGALIHRSRPWAE